MPRDNDSRDIGRAEDDFNDFLDALARGESTAGIDIEPSLASTVMQMQRMAARTRPEAHQMYRTWSTVGASASGELNVTPPASAPVSARKAFGVRIRPEQRGSWRFTNHVALAAVLIVALVTGYAGIRGGLPGGGQSQNFGAIASPQSGTYNVIPNLNCTTDPKSVEEIETIMSTPVAQQNPSDVMVVGETPDDETIAGVERTQQQLVACGEDPLQLYALYSDSCLRSELLARYPDADLKPAIVGTEVATDATMMAGKRETAVRFATPSAGTEGVFDVILPQDIEMLSDGRTGAIVRQASTGGETTLVPQNPRYRFFVKVGDQWLYDCDAPQSRG